MKKKDLNKMELQLYQLAIDAGWNKKDTLMLVHPQANSIRQATANLLSMIVINLNDKYSNFDSGEFFSKDEFISITKDKQLVLARKNKALHNTPELIRFNSLLKLCLDQFQ